jgi:hypothetical protein
VLPEPVKGAFEVEEEVAAEEFEVEVEEVVTPGISSVATTLPFLRESQSVSIQRRL